MRITGWAAAAVLLVACSSGGGGGKADAGTTGGLCPTPVSTNACEDGCNPCTRVTDAQVAMAVGLPAVQGMQNSDVCEWDFTDATGNPFEVSFGVNIDYRTFEDECHVTNDPDSGITVTAVSGVGDDACYVETGGALQAYDLTFLKGCEAYQVEVVGLPGHTPPFTNDMLQAIEKAIAIDAVPNL
jgi:hypothetical protein